MSRSAKISLGIPNAHAEGRYFSFPLKKTILPEPCEFPEASQMFIISDIEGNFKSLTRILTKGGVVDKYLHWIFNDGHLVILGDCFDRGPDVIECLWLIYSLEEQAHKNGGYVHFILGNHEIMNLNGDWRYIHPKYALSTNENSPPIALYHGNQELWRWLCSKNILEIVGKILFVHGGISPTILQKNLTVRQINDLVTPWYHRLADLPETDPAFLLLHSEDAPIWYRGYYRNEVDELFIDKVLTAYKVQTIVTGHSMVEKVSGFFNNKLIDVDTDHANGITEGLLIRKGGFYRIGNLEHKDKIK